MKNKRVIISLVINVIIFILMILSLVIMFTGFKFMHGIEPVLETTKFGVLKFFTVDSNILIGITALIFAIEETKLLKDNKKEINRKLYIIKLASTAAVSITFITVFTYLGYIVEGGIPAMLQNSNLFLHLIIPVLSIITFIVFEKTDKIKKREVLFGIVPTLLYEVFYLINIVIHMENGKVSPVYDWYWFLQQGVWTAVIVGPFMLLMAYLVSLLLWKLNQKS